MTCVKVAPEHEAEHFMRFTCRPSAPIPVKWCSR